MCDKCCARRITSSNVDFERRFLGHRVSESVDVSAQLS